MKQLTGNEIVKAVVLMAFAWASVECIAGDKQVGTQGSRTSTNVNVSVDEKTDNVHLISTTNDPKVISKTYILKHADPYEIRPILEGMVNAKRVNRSRTGVECIKYKDGTGGVIVSAEDYRFKTTKKSIGIDDLIKRLDQPGATANDGDDVMVYLPKYSNARSNAKFIRRMGFDPPEIPGEGVVVDRQLNAVVVKSVPFRQKTIKGLAEAYDQSVPMVEIHFSVFSLKKSESLEAFLSQYQRWLKGQPKSGANDNNVLVARAPFAGKEPIRVAFLNFLVKTQKAVSMASGAAMVQHQYPWKIQQMKPMVLPGRNIVVGKETGVSGTITPLVGKKGTTLNVNLDIRFFDGYNKRRRPVVGQNRINTMIQVSNDNNAYLLGGAVSQSKGNDASIGTTTGLSKDETLSRFLVLISCKLPEGDR